MSSMSCSPGLAVSLVLRVNFRKFSVFTCFTQYFAMVLIVIHLLAEFAAANDDDDDDDADQRISYWLIHNFQSSKHRPGE